MAFKVGDKVRIINIPSKISGCEGVITEVRPPERGYHYNGLFYSTSTKRNFYYPLKDNQVESCLRKGEQLLFPFMSEAME